MLEKADMLEDENIKSWLYEVVRNKIRKLEKLKANEKSGIQKIEKYSIMQESYTVDRDLDFKEERELSDEETEIIKDVIISFLSDDEKQLYELRFVNGKRYSEISAETGISEKTLSVKCYRLKEKIKEIAKAYIK